MSAADVSSTSLPATGRDAGGLNVAALKGVGPRVAQRLQKLGIRTVQDVLFHLPARYEDRTRVVAIGSLRPGVQAAIQARIELTEIAYGRRRTLLCRVSDGTGALTLRFFHFSAAQQATLERGAVVSCYGEVRAGRSGLEIVHPEYRRVRDTATDVASQPHLTPVYPTTQGIHQLKLRDLTDQALDWLQRQPQELQEWLPDSVLAQFRLPSLHAALRLVHRPPPECELHELESGVHPAQQRLAFEELLAHHLSLRQLRGRLQQHRAPVLATEGELIPRFLRSLPFALTAAQQRVCAEIETDLEQPYPMLRLVQGDVGSGKTVVAAASALKAVEAGYQVALMAPTELLAEQHFRNFSAWLEPLGVQVQWLSGKLSARARRQAIAQVQSGEARVVVGTHALFQEGVEFRHLALAIVDEQHRFGVHQRLALREKGRRNQTSPHQLIMTATPIPRTLAMTAYADLDNSVIDELPPGRIPVNTVVLPESRRADVVARVADACRRGRQAYWVCTLIEESEALQAQAAAETASRLAEALPELRLGLVHGRLKPAEKEQVMARFKEGELDLLIATTVIEVGVDVPNASLIIIENSERLGLAQLHQLRGRVGRGSAESSCVLMYRGALSITARARLAALRDTNDGFEIARRDLELRGPGEVLGTRQTGMLQLRVADLLRDRRLLPAVQRAAEILHREHPDCIVPLVRRWLGDGARYGAV